MDKKQQIITALYAFVAQRSGMDYSNYGDAKSYRAEQRSITRDGAEARRLIRDVELRDSITAADILESAQRAFSGRLSIVVRADGAVAVDYCTGQYFPTEYRKAVCAVMAHCLWHWKRTQCMPAPVIKQHGSADKPPMLTEELYDGLHGGDWLRRSFRREYGRGIQSRWFN